MTRRACLCCLNRASPVLRAIGCALALLSPSAASGQAPQEPAVLRFGISIPGRTVTVRDAMAPWAEAVSAAAGDSLEIELYTGGSLGRSGKLQYWLLQQGVLDITWILPSDTPGRFQSTDFFEIPLETDDPLEMSLAFWRMYERGHLTGFEDIKPLALYVSPAYRFHLRFDYEGPQSLHGRKIRAVTYLQARLLEEAGATPIGGITTTQVAESLTRGMLDGALFSWHGVQPVGIMRATSTHVDQAVTFAPAMIAMNRESYESLPPGDRAIIDEMSGEPLVRMMVEAMENQARRAITEARRDPDRAFVESDPEEVRIWRERFTAAVEDWRQADPSHDVIVDRFHEILAEIRAETEAGEVPVQ